MKETPFKLPVCICPAALTVVVKLVADARCAEKSLNTREFIFLEDFHKRFTMETTIGLCSVDYHDFNRVVTN